jgi:cell division protein FtsL|tara:strand:+ start:388 stop:711 length:324 start_codon:yes stop_codon:yes gene_type:complete
MIDVNNISLIRNKSKIFKIVKSACAKSSYFLIIISLLFIIISTKAYITKIGYELAINNNKLQEIRLENKILHTEISKLKSNSRLEEQALKYNMKFPKKGDIKTIIYE